jgi:hypothetical protein
MAYELTEADDLLHAPLAADLYWTETVYLGFANLEHKLAGIIYPILRPNQGVCSLSIFLWDDSGEVGHDILYFQNFWHIPPPDDLRNIELQVGFTHQCIEPFKEYQVHYEDDVELRLDLNYLSLHEPVGRGQANVVSSYNQIYHVTGGLKLNGDELDIDCYELRGQFWGTRTDRRQVRPPMILLNRRATAIRTVLLSSVRSLSAQPVITSRHRCTPATTSETANSDRSWKGPAWSPGAVVVTQW